LYNVHNVFFFEIILIKFIILKKNFLILI